MRLKSSQAGFSAVEAILVMVIMGIIGFTGWFVWHSKQIADKTLASNDSSNTAVTPKKLTTSTTANATPAQTTPVPPVTLKAYTMKQHGDSFKYPSNWVLKDDSSIGSDLVTLTAPSGFSLTLRVSSLGHPGSDTQRTVLGSVPVVNASLGNGYMDYVAAGSSSSLVSNFTYSHSATDPYDDFSAGGIGIFVQGSSIAQKSVAAAKTDSDYAAAAQLLTTIVYGA